MIQKKVYIDQKQNHISIFYKIYTNHTNKLIKRNIMGTQCSNLYDQVISSTNSRTKIFSFIDNQSTQKKSTQNSNQNISMNLNLSHQISCLKSIQNQVIKPNSSDILSYQKYSQNRYLIKFIDQSQYKGHLNQLGQRQKEGQQKWSDNKRYMGYWKENLPHGDGIFIDPKGFTFQGKWEYGNVQGFGKYYGRNGTFEGNWKNNHPHGYGIESWDDGSKYQGYYQNGKKHGKGTYVWPDKSIYKGQWYEGKISGQGIYKYQDGRSYQGFFVDNKMHGAGTYIWPDGRKYIGQYKNDKKQGFGRYYWADGRIYQGQWRQGCRNGNGKIMFPNGTVKYGLWDNDKKIQQTLPLTQKIKQNVFQHVTLFQQNEKYNIDSPNFKYKQNRLRNSSLQTAQKVYQRRSLRNSKKSSYSLKKTQRSSINRPNSSNSKNKSIQKYYQQYQLSESKMYKNILNRQNFISSPLKSDNKNKHSNQFVRSFTLNHQKPYQSRSFIDKNKQFQNNNQEGYSSKYRNWKSIRKNQQVYDSNMFSGQFGRRKSTSYMEKYLLKSMKKEE